MLTPEAGLLHSDPSIPDIDFLSTSDDCFRNQRTHWELYQNSHKSEKIPQVMAAIFRMKYY